MICRNAAVRSVTVGNRTMNSLFILLKEKLDKWEQKTSPSMKLFLKKVVLKKLNFSDEASFCSRGLKEETAEETNKGNDLKFHILQLFIWLAFSQLYLGKL